MLLNNSRIFCVVLALLVCACDTPRDERQAFGPMTCTFYPDGAWQLDVTQAFAGYDGLAQELVITNDIGGNHTLIEFTRHNGHSSHIDRHFGIVGATRVMRLYPASVSGAGTQAPLVLASNLDASILSPNPCTFLNPPDGVTGQVTAMGAVYEWRIEATPAGVTVTTPDGVKFFPR